MGARDDPDVLKVREHAEHFGGKQRGFFFGLAFGDGIALGDGISGRRRNALRALDVGNARLGNDARDVLLRLAIDAAQNDAVVEVCQKLHGLSLSPHLAREVGNRLCGDKRSQTGTAPLVEDLQKRRTADFACFVDKDIDGNAPARRAFLFRIDSLIGARSLPINDCFFGASCSVP